VEEIKRVNIKAGRKEFLYKTSCLFSIKLRYNTWLVTIVNRKIKFNQDGKYIKKETIRFQMGRSEASKTGFALNIVLAQKINRIIGIISRLAVCVDLKKRIIV
jgi:hypothetical protein